MIMQAQTIKENIEKNLPDCIAIMEGEDDGVHFNAKVISSAFKDKTRIERHKLVYEIFNAELKSGKLHALQLKTYTPEEWETLLTIWIN